MEEGLPNVSGLEGNRIQVILLAVGIVSLLIGCSVAYIRSNEETSRTELEKDCQELTAKVLGSGEPGSGMIRMGMIGSVAESLKDDEILKGRAAGLILTPFGGSPIEIYLPDEGSFKDKGSGKSSTTRTLVPVDLGGGRIAPGWMEVVLLE
jgi:hypothetical protein